MSDAARNGLETWSPSAIPQLSLVERHESDSFRPVEPEARRLSIAREPLARGVENADCRNLWDELKSGVWRIERSYSDAERYYFQLVEGPAASPSMPRSKPRVGVLEEALLGNMPKCIAYTRGISCSTIASRARREVLQMGLQCIPSKAPLLLWVLVQIGVLGRRAPTLCVSRFSGDVNYLTVSIERPELRLSRVLTQTEIAVVSGIVSGQSQREVAATRRVSPRTIANQCSSTFRRLNISGRSDLIRLLATMATEPSSDPAGPVSSLELASAR